MELHLKIGDVVGMDEDKRHILYVNSEDLVESLMEKETWLYDTLFKQHILKKGSRVLSEMLDNKELRNTIYMQEKAKRERDGRL